MPTFEETGEHLDATGEVQEFARKLLDHAGAMAVGGMKAVPTPQELTQVSVSVAVQALLHVIFAERLEAARDGDDLEAESLKTSVFMFHAFVGVGSGAGAALAEFPRLVNQPLDPAFTKSAAETVSSAMAECAAAASKKIAESDA